MRKFGIQFLLCLVLSATVWLIHNLSLFYTETVNVQVSVQCNLEGRTCKAEQDATVSARCRAKGFRLLNLNLRKRPVTVTVDRKSLIHKKGDNFVLPASAVYSYSSQIFGEGSSVEALVSGDIQLTFPMENNRRVPVIGVQDINYKSQYCALKPMSFKPDSVTIYGTPEAIDGIVAVHTRQIDYSNLSRSVHGTVKLESISGVRISETETNYSLEVGRYVEMSSEMRVRTRNVPSGTELAVLPGVVTVTMRCPFPMNGDPFENTLFWVDWKEFSKSSTGKCVVRWSNLPDYVISCRTEPAVCECFEK